MDCIKLSNFSTAKEAINTVKRQHMDWIKYLLSIYLLSIIYPKYAKKSYVPKARNQITQSKMDKGNKQTLLNRSYINSQLVKENSHPH
jgi:hypothetical protein